MTPGVCGINADCENTPGNYSCLCKNGYHGDPYNGCVDIDECLEPNICGPGAVCTNLEGSYVCRCPDGFEGIDPKSTGCVDINECARTPCGRNEECRNEVGSYKCLPIKSKLRKELNGFYINNSKFKISDVNECLKKPCGKNAICTDTIGMIIKLKSWFILNISFYKILFVQDLLFAHVSQNLLAILTKNVRILMNVQP